MYYTRKTTVNSYGTSFYRKAVRQLKILMTLALSFVPGRHGVIEDGVDGGVDVEH